MHWRRKSNRDMFRHINEPNALQPLTQYHGASNKKMKMKMKRKHSHITIQSIDNNTTQQAYFAWDEIDRMNE
jgi:hypothetical protein